MREFEIGGTKRRKLASLQKQIEDYSRRAWYTVPAGKAPRGVDPNAPREPAFLGVRVRLAARVVDERLGGNPANMGVCDCLPCGCELRDARGWYVACEHDLACPHDGTEGEPDKVSARLRALAEEDSPTLAGALARGGVDAVYEAAGLTPAETQVARYKHEGLTHGEIAFLTNRKEGTVYALYHRAKQELRALVDRDRLVAAEAA